MCELQVSCRHLAALKNSSSGLRTVVQPPDLAGPDRISYGEIGGRGRFVTRSPATVTGGTPCSRGFSGPYGGTMMGEGVPIMRMVYSSCDALESQRCAVMSRPRSVSLSHDRRVFMLEQRRPMAVMGPRPRPVDRWPRLLGYPVFRPEHYQSVRCRALS
jgi:hypothetical protein